MGAAVGACAFATGAAGVCCAAADCAMAIMLHSANMDKEVSGLRVNRRVMVSPSFGSK
jgi:hypothetical protein